MTEKVKYIDTLGAVYLKTKINSEQTKLGFFSSKDDSLVFEWTIGSDEECTLEEAKELENKCIIGCKEEDGKTTLKDVTNAYFEIEEDKAPKPLPNVPLKNLIVEVKETQNGYK